jgi:hypothetical protein
MGFALSFFLLINQITFFGGQIVLQGKYNISVLTLTKNNPIAG